MNKDEYWQSVGFMVNTRALEGLSPETRDALERAYADAAAYGTEQVEAAAAESVERMKAEGVNFYDMDLTPFVETMATFYDAHSGDLPDGFFAAVDATRTAQ
ncbi:hypothetical protein [Salipiger mangrovisoli]|uniref:Extracellular solute-binding protein, family 7 n=1 Tax=Salipiger mangrovisoli TaxID=2865933 RepID=A0ABR9X8N2_9RHOB|nr:hypothetical protein [Salipiger mangrovisoli]MBE9639802.1 hypothetical protein [Salipiger mangrovisoli]